MYSEAAWNNYEFQREEAKICIEIIKLLSLTSGPGDAEIA